MPTRFPRRLARAAAIAAVVAVAAAACQSGGPAAPAPAPTPTAPTPTAPVPAAPAVDAVRGVHDPAIAKEDGVYWVYSTGRGIPMRRSRDLVRWETVGSVFPTPLPAWAAAAVPGTEFPWAPDVSYFGGRWHLYYALSTFGGQNSVIGHATNAVLDPADARYKWEDQGEVLRSRAGVSTYNAIDATVALDAEGTPWLAWGSFWGGLKMRRLDAATGRPSAADTTTYALAARAGTEATTGPTDSQAIEAPTVVAHGGWYYLFASFDLCCRGSGSTYNIRVGRARAITGPYVDAAGVPMTGGGGTRVLEGSGRVRGPGHQAVLVDGAQTYLVHHFYDEQANGAPTLQVRPLTWDADGWPRAGEPLAPPPAASRAPTR